MTDTLKQFKAKVHEYGLLPLWERQVKLAPGSHCVPVHFPYDTIRPLLDEAAHLISKKDADRRVLVMENPMLRGSSFIAQSLFAGQQIIQFRDDFLSHLVIKLFLLNFGKWF
jgi:gentisate 1,2-dioxygenase